MAIAESPAPRAPARSTPAALSLRPGLGWPALLGVVAFATTLVITGRLLVVDALMDLYAGRQIVAHGLPHTDTLTVAGAGHRWIDQQWLAHIVLYELFRTVGWYGPALLCAAAVGAAVGGLAAILVRRGLPAGMAMAWPTVGYFVAVQNTTVRAQTLAYPLFVAVLAVVLADYRRRRPARSSLWALAVLVLWANIHGSVLIGIASLAGGSLLCAAIAVREGRRRDARDFAGLALAAVLTVFVTPYSPSDLIAYYRSVIGNPVIAKVVSEWQPPTPIGSWPFFVLAFAAVAVVGLTVWKRRLPALPAVAIGAGLALAGLTAVRYDVWFALAGVLVLGEGAAVLLGYPSRPAGRSQTPLDRVVGRAGVVAVGFAAIVPLVAPSRTNQLSALVFGGVVMAAQARSAIPGCRPGRPLLVAVAVVVAACGAKALTTSPSGYYAGASLPAVHAAARFAATHPGARIMADSSSAPQLLWSEPQLAGRVGFDIRYEIYPTSAIAAYVRFMTGYRDTGWASSLRGYSIVVVSRTFAPQLTTAVAHLRGWRVLESDRNGLVAVRAS
ncbi:MAG TPA: hypothetical protein VKV34_03425 [Thermoleophilia bacterium]|nr:hypothetical protein [Thermoleophilia bacterium]